VYVKTLRGHIYGLGLRPFMVRLFGLRPFWFSAFLIPNQRIICALGLGIKFQNVFWVCILGLCAQLKKSWGNTIMYLMLILSTRKQEGGIAE